MKAKFSEVKKVYTSAADAVQRGFYAYLRRLQKDAAAAQADADAAAAKQEAEAAAQEAKAAKKRAADLQRAAKKDAAKQEAAAKAQQEAEAAEAKAAEAKAKQTQKAEAAKKAAAESAADAVKREAVESLRAVMQRKQLRAEDFTKDFLLQYLPERFNAAQQLCKVAEVKPEEAAVAREKYPALLVEREEKTFCYTPILYFTANSLLSQFTKAADARKKQREEEAENLSAAEKEAKKAEAEAKKRKKYEELRAKVEKYFSEVAAQEAEAAKK